MLIITHGMMISLRNLIYNFVMTDITYRKATVNDIEQLVRLTVSFTDFNVKGANTAKGFYFEDWENSFRDELRDSITGSESAIFCAIADTVFIGYVGVHFDKHEYCCVIDELFVDENYRGKHVGDELIKYAEVWSKDFSPKMKVEVYDWNASAISFYARVGYEKNAVVMEKELDV